MDSSGASLLVFLDSVLIATSRTLENMDIGSLETVWSCREFLRSGALKGADDTDSIRINLYCYRTLKERDREYESTFSL
jgi:hypothetical protein